MKQLFTLFYFLVSTNLSIAQWTQTNGPTGGNFNCIATSGSKIFAGANDKNYGVFVSDNKGLNWSQLTNGLPQYPKVKSIASIGKDIIISVEDSGIYVSNDTGSTWHISNAGLTNHNINVLTTYGSNLLAGYDYGIFKSSDTGQTWFPFGSIGSMTPIYSIVVSDTIIIAGSDGTVIRSSTNGGPWKTIPSWGFGVPVNSLIKYGKYFLAASSLKGVLLSPDSGANWSLVNTGISLHTDVTCLATDGNYIYASSNNGMYVSADTGSHWIKSNHGIFITDVLTVIADGNEIYIGTSGGGIYFSNDHGLNWVPINTNLVCTNVTSFIENGNVFAGTDGTGIFKSVNGNDWTPIDSGITSPVIYSLASIGNNLFAGTSRQGVFLSKNNGFTWDSINTGISNPKHIISMISKGSMLIAATYDSIYRSIDSGSTWIAVGNGINPYGMNCLITDGNNIFVSAANSNNHIYSSTDGITWLPFGNNLPVGANAFGILGDTILAGTDLGIYKSSINNAYWFTANVIPSPVQSFATVANWVLAGTFGYGVFASNDKGDTWTPFHTGLEDGDIYSLMIGSQYIYAGTGFRGAWKRPLNQLVSVLEYNAKLDFSVYPNPSSDNFKLHINADEQLNNINVFDIAGNMIYSKDLSPGNQKELTINLSNHPAGIYIIQVKSKNNSYWKKAVKY